MRKYMTEGKTVNLTPIDHIWLYRIRNGCEFVIAEPLKRRDYRAIAKLKREGLIDGDGELTPNKCCYRLKGEEAFPAYSIPPFHERYWWLPCAISGVGIVISIFAIIRRITR